MIQIKSNGSKWNGQEPDNLEILLDLLAQEPLDRSMEAYILPNPNPHNSYDWKPLFENSNTWHFSGNFYTCSHIFSIFTDEQDLIDKLKTAIYENMASLAYLEQDPPKNHLACPINKKMLIHV